jgi:hypothetical protein
MEGSKYFRLELELAARSGKSGIVLTDRRFRGIIDVPPTMLREQFDVREIAGDGAKPSSNRFERAFSEFCERVGAALQHDLRVGNPARDSDTVGLLLPVGPAHGYQPEELEAISTAVKRAHYKPVPMSWPPSITPGWISDVDASNWIIADVGAESMATGVIGFLHGAFVPTMRLMRVETAKDAEPRLMPESALYGGVEVGYRKDVARWWDTATLITEIVNPAYAGRCNPPFRHTGRGTRLPRRLRNEGRVFISYPAPTKGNEDLRAAFVRRFQEVLTIGTANRLPRPALDRSNLNSLSSPVCVPLLSSTYVASGNCIHELDDAVPCVTPKRRASSDQTEEG